jgi:hypothetical protein
VIDQKADPVCQPLDRDRKGVPITFSSDGKHVAYVCKRNGHVVVVADGKEMGPYDLVGQFGMGEGMVYFLADGTVTFIAIQEGHSVIVAGDRTRGPYEAVWGPMLSTDLAAAFYLVKKGQKEHVVFMDGREGPPVEKINDAYAGTGGHYAYSYQEGGKTCVVVDGAVVRKDLSVESQFMCQSPDGRRYAWNEIEAGVAYAVVDGKRGQPFQSIGGGVVFTADGSHAIYCGEAGKEYCVVVDGVVQARSDEDVTDSIVCAPVGSSYAYRVVHRGVSRAVIDGETQPGHDSVGDVAFSKDGKEWAYVADDGSVQHVVLMGQEGLVPSSISQLRDCVFLRDPYPYRVVFVGPSHVSYLASQETSAGRFLVRVDCKASGK